MHEWDILWCIASQCLCKSYDHW